MVNEAERPANMSDLAMAFGAVTVATGGIGLYNSLAIVGALAEAGVLQPLAVARWAEFFAKSAPRGTPGAEQIESGVLGFARALKALATKPPGAGRA